MAKQIWPKELNKLFVTGFSANISDMEISTFCEEFGAFIRMDRTIDKTKVFLLYSNEFAAAQALKNFKDKLIYANYANDKRNANSSGSSSPKETSSASDSNHVRFTCGENSNGVQQSKTKGTYFKSGEEVIITHVKYTHQFYARPKAMDNEYKQLIQIIAESVTAADRLNQRPSERQLVLVPYDADFRRGIVQKSIKNHPELAVVHLLDYGLTLEVPCEELRVCPEDLNFPRLTYKFFLRGCKFDTLYSEQCFMSFTGATFKMEHDKPNIEQKSLVRLFDPKTNQNINDLINQMTRTFTVEQLLFEPAPIGTHKDLDVIDLTKLEKGDNLITFVDKKNKLMYLKQRNRIHDIAQIIAKFPEYLPTQDELCLVQFDDYWYRGLFVETYYETAVVLLLDVQTGVQVPLKNIRKIIKDFVKMPILTFTATCTTNGCKDKINDQEVKRLIHKFKSDQIHANFIGVCQKGDKYVIEV